MTPKEYAESVSVKDITVARRSRRGTLALIARAYEAGKGSRSSTAKKAALKKESPK